jgi:hypothetical protein
MWSENIDTDDTDEIYGQLMNKRTLDTDHGG